MKRSLAAMMSFWGIFLSFHELPGQSTDIPTPDMCFALERGKDFAEAYKFFLEAPRNSYDYSKSKEAFRNIIEGSKQVEARKEAAYFLCLADFSSLKFQDALKDSAILLSFIKKSATGSPEIKTACQIMEMTANEEIKYFPQLRRLVSLNSCFKIMLPCDPKEKLMDATITEQVLDYIDLLAKMRESKIYEIAPGKIGEAKKKDIGNECAAIIKLVEKNVAQIQKIQNKDFLGLVGLLALESALLSKNYPDLKNTIALAICAHNMSQIGIAFHLYLLDNDTKFPPLSVKRKVPFKGKEVELQEMYLDLLKPYFGLPDGEVIEFYGIYREIPEDSPFQCPSSIPCKIGSLCHYGYNAMYPFAHSKGTEANLASGEVKFSMIKPESHLVITDTCYFGAQDGRGITRLYSLGTLRPAHQGRVNVLYADGHVNAEDINWLRESDPSGSPWNSNVAYKRRNDVKPDTK